MTPAPSAPTPAREHERTHPWITFRFDPQEIGPRLSGLLGQAVARCEQVADAVLPPETAQELDALALVRGVRATTAIEGNTLSEAQVRGQIEGRLDLPPSLRHLGREVDNVVAIYRELTDAARQGRPLPLTPDRICGWNGRTLAGLEGHLHPAVVPGQIREHRVVVGRYRGAPPEDCRHLLDRMCEWIAPDLEVPVGSRAQNRLAGAVVRALLAHLYLAWIHPFGDGNGRAARLAEFAILVAAGVPPAAAHLSAHHFWRTRPEYYFQLDRSSRAGEGDGDALGFLTYAVDGFGKRLARLRAEIEYRQSRITWEHLARDRTRSSGSAASARRRDELATRLAERRQPTPRSAIPRLSPALAGMFAGKTTKTLARDLDWLLEAGLLERTPGGYRARLEILRGFRPPPSG